MPRPSLAPKRTPSMPRADEPAAGVTPARLSQAWHDDEPGQLAWPGGEFVLPGDVTSYRLVGERAADDCWAVEPEPHVGQTFAQRRDLPRSRAEGLTAEPVPAPGPEPAKARAPSGSRAGQGASPGP